MVVGSSPITITKTSDFPPVSSKEFLDIQNYSGWIHSETCTTHYKNMQCRNVLWFDMIISSPFECV